MSNPRRPEATVAGALVLLALPVLARAYTEAFSPTYEAAVRRYASGDRDRAIADVCGWPEGPVRDEIAALRRRARSPSPRTPVLAAALMLHTDCALRARREGASPRLHEWAALELASLLKDDHERRAFARRWYVVMAELAFAEKRPDDAMAWAERGRHDFPDSAEMLVVVGWLEETWVVRAGSGVSEEDAPDLVTRQALSRLVDLHEVRQHLERAARALRAAATAEPSLAEARLRLGRVAWRLGEADEARSVLEDVLARKPEAATAFLAHLFLGRLDEDAGRLGEAARSYEAALAIDPRCQSARLALSHVRLRLGDAAAARAEVETALKAGGHRPTADAFSLYPWGPSVGVEERLEALRREASSP